MNRFLIRLAVFVFAAGFAAAQNPAAPAAACTVAGRVFKAGSGEPLKSARVRLVNSEKRDEQHTYHAVTDANGAFVITGVSPGHYRFSAMRNGYVSQEFKAKRDSVEGAILTLTSGQQLTDVLFRLVRAAVVVGRVTGEDGEPVAGVEVEALMKASPENEEEKEETPIPREALVPASIAATNDLGEYRLYGLPPGEYYFAAVDSGDPHLSDYNVREGSYFYELGSEPKTNNPPMYYPGVFQRDQAQRLALRAGDEMRVDFALRPARTIVVSGHVLGPDGKVAAGANVMVMSRNLDTMFTSLRNAAKVDAQGQFRVDGIAAGTYVVTASQWVDKTHYSAKQKIEADNNDIANVALVLGKGATVRGRVVPAVQAAFTPSEAHVWLSPLDDAAMGFGAAEVNKDGTFTISDLEDNTYRVHLSGLADGWYLKSARLGTEDILEHGLKVARGMGSASLDLVVSPNAAQVHGTVAQAGSAVAGANVQLRPEAENPYRKDLWRMTKTDQYGHFLLKNVPPGRYLISASVGDEQRESSNSEPLKLALTESENTSVNLDMPSAGR